MRKIKYKGEIYTVSRSDKSKIRRIILVLFLKRWQRRVFRFFPKNGGQYILILILWVAFGVVFYLIRKAYMAPEIYIWQDTVWELIIQFFTSFVLVVAICGYTQAIDYRRIIREQYIMYVDTLYEFDDIFKPYLGDELSDYMPFFNDKCIDDTLIYIQQNNLTKRKIDKSDYSEVLESILEQLDEIKNKMMDDAIEGMRRDVLRDSLKEARKMIKRLNIKGNSGGSHNIYHPQKAGGREYVRRSEPPNCPCRRPARRRIYPAHL